MSRSARSATGPKPISEHGINWFRIVRRVIFAAAMIALAVFLAVQRGFDDPLPFALLTLTAVVILVVGALWLLLTVARTLARNPRVVVYRQGVRSISRKGERRWRWSSFTELQDTTRVYRLLGVPLYATGRYTLYVKGAPALSVGHELRRARELGALLEEKTAEVMWQSFVVPYQRGKPIPFGSIVINQDRIQQGRKTVLWNDVYDWDLRRGALALRYKDSRNNGRDRVARFRFFGTPNAHILARFVESMLQYRQA
ncbi:MAG: hypothetical protein Kow00120_16490 [Anaerolineae bacterium]